MRDAMSGGMSGSRGEYGGDVVARPAMGEQTGALGEWRPRSQITF